MDCVVSLNKRQILKQFKLYRSLAQIITKFSLSTLIKKILNPLDSR